MLTEKEKELKKEILALTRVVPTSEFDAKKAIALRVQYLKDYIRQYNMRGIVLGISGGVDSTTAGKIAQMAVSELKNENYDATFIAMRLPYKTQQDESDAQDAIRFISPDEVLDVNIGAGTDGIFNSVLSAMHESTSNETNTVCSNDFAKGNVKARMRMIAQYAVAGLRNCLVLGTDHSAEFTAGFYTKGGDGFCDLTVLDHLNKRQVRLCAKELGAPEKLWSKVATADLEDDKPQLPDEVALGFTYEQMDDFLENKAVSYEVQKKIIHQYLITQHKRKMPHNFS